MAKRKVSSSSLESPNHILDGFNSHLTSKNQFVINKLMNNDVQHILNKISSSNKGNKHNMSKTISDPQLKLGSDESDDDSSSSLQNKQKNHITDKKTNKIKKRKREEVSSSSESTYEPRMPMPIAKKESVSSTDESVLSDDVSKKPNISNKRTINNKDEDSTDSEEERQNILRNFLPRQIDIKKDDSCSTEDGIIEKGTVGVSERKRIHKKSRATSLKKRKNSAHVDDSDNEVSAINKTNMEDSLEPEEDLANNTVNAPSPSKVNVLQDIRLNSPKVKSLKEKLEEVYPGVKQVKDSTKLNFSKLEDIYLFQIPKNVDPLSLKNIEVSLQEKCKINIGEKYIIENTQNVPLPTLVVSDDCKVMSFKGNIRMEKCIKTKKKSNISVPEKKHMPLPNNLKKRHPLFGSDYKQKIKLREEVEKKLETAIENLWRKEERKKRKHKKSIREDKEEHQNETIFNLLNSHNSIDNNRKIKKETSDDSAFCSSSSVEKAETITKNSWPAIEAKKIKTEIFTENESDHLENLDVPPKRNKKGKRLKNDNNTNVKQKDISLISSDNENKLTVINSTLIPDSLKPPVFNAEVSSISFEESSFKKKTKKSKKKSKSDEDRSVVEKKLISNILDSIKSEISSPGKVKKKKSHV